MTSNQIRDDQWPKILDFLKKSKNIYIGKESKCRRFIEAVIWIARSGAQWRFLPNSYGKWNTVYKRFARWEEKEVWKKLFEFVSNDPDMEHFMIDSTIVRAHPCSAGAPKKREDKRNTLSDAQEADSQPKSI